MSDTFMMPMTARLKGKLERGCNAATGGFQGHARRVMAACVGDELHIDDDLLGQTYRYAFCYGRGTWQKVCQALLSHIALHLTQPKPHE